MTTQNEQAQKAIERYEELKKQGLAAKYERAGIYSISIDEKLVYIGKSRNMLYRLATHIEEIEKEDQRTHKYWVLRSAQKLGYSINFGVLYYSPFEDEEESDNDIGEMEGILIRKHMPPLNTQIPKADNWHTYTYNKRAKAITLSEILGKPQTDYKF